MHSPMRSADVHLSVVEENGVPQLVVFVGDEGRSAAPLTELTAEKLVGTIKAIGLDWWQHETGSPE